MGAPLVELDGVYRNFDDLEVLKPVRLTIDIGDHLAVVGSSGSGKSTLLNLLGLLDSPTGGRATYSGVEVTNLSERERTTMRRREIGFVFQSFHLMPRRTVLDNVLAGMRYQQRPRRDMLERAGAAIERVGLVDRRDHRPETLSGGERQRVAIARAVARGGRLLLADEPTGSLDVRNTFEILDLFDDLLADGAMALVVVSHDDRVAARARSVVSIEDGILTARAP